MVLPRTFFSLLKRIFLRYRVGNNLSRSAGQSLQETVFVEAGSVAGVPLDAAYAVCSATILRTWVKLFTCLLQNVSTVDLIDLTLLERTLAAT